MKTHCYPIKFITAVAVACLLSIPVAWTAPAEKTVSANVVAVGFSPGNAESIVLETIHGAKKEIRMAAYSFTAKPIAEAILKAQRRGVKVYVILDKSQETEHYSVATFLANNQIPFRINRKYAIQHNKFLIMDGETVQTGSYNYTSSAANRNAENVIVLQGKEVAGAYTVEWNRLWQESEIKDQASSR